MRAPQAKTRQISTRSGVSIRARVPLASGRRAAARRIDDRVSERDSEDPAYEARPIDTSGVQLPPDVERLIPTLAENAHEVWALARSSEGWRYGSQRDEDRKLHPSLVHYAQLPPSEREYDQILVCEVLKVLIATGYRLEKA